MNLIDALCIIASSYNARSKEEEQVYINARDVVEEHADTVMHRERAQDLIVEANTLVAGLESMVKASLVARSRGELQ